jgi:hypothetical protein
MNAPAAPRPRHRTSSWPLPLFWLLPLLFGVAVGLYAAWLDSDNQPADSGRTAVVGVVSGAVVAVLCYLLGRGQAALPHELRAAAYGAVCGCALGYLFSLSGWTALKASAGGLIAGLVMTAASFYVFYVFHTHED